MKVAIIGAGASGLAAIKCCLEEGMTPVCFEKQTDIGGLWRYVPTTKDGAAVYKSTVINSSKEMMCFSDFPIPKEFANYMHNTKVHEYFKMYAKKFGLYDHIRYHTKVVSCVQEEKFAETGRWKVVTENSKTCEQELEFYDGVMVCVGHHAVPHFPLEDFPGIDIFKGKYIHSHDYRDHTGYENLRVVVIGIGDSGGDIAVELSRHAKQVYLSTRRGAWIFRRQDKEGLPGDLINTRIVNAHIANILPESIKNKAGVKEVNSNFNHEKYGLKPKHKVFAQHPSLNDEIGKRIITGGIEVRCNVTRFTETSAIFDDGTEEEIDAVIFATGYSIEYPFLEESVLKLNENSCDLYKYIYPITLARNTLAIIGAVQPLGSVIPVSEMQCRWATKVIKGEVKLPSKEEMKTDIEKNRQTINQNYVNSRRHTIQVDYVDYMMDMAKSISCKPNILKYLFTDPVLAFKVFFGPALPYIFRLEGSGQWSDARKMIMTVDERISYPLKKRKVETQAQSDGLIVGKLFMTGILIYIVLWFLL